jgi:hypothetical protein
MKQPDDKSRRRFLKSSSILGLVGFAGPNPAQPTWFSQETLAQGDHVRVMCITKIKIIFTLRVPQCGGMS